MGLDYVEIVLRTEEFFAITIDDEKAGSVRTIGDFYQLICTKLAVPQLRSPVTSSALPPVHMALRLGPWSPQDVWDCLVAILVDEQGLNPKEVRHESRIAEDLGIS